MMLILQFMAQFLSTIIIIKKSGGFNMFFRLKQLKITLILFLFGFGFSFAQTITVTAPSAGQTWYKGQVYTIRWTKSGSMNSYVKIRLYQGSTKVLGIVDSTENDGSYTWTVPTTLAPGTYFIRVKTVDNQVFDDGDNFTIADDVRIIVNKPYWGDKWLFGETHKIKWTTKGTMNPNVKIRLYRNGNKILSITDSTPNSGEYEWKIPSNLTQASDYKIRVKTIDNKVFGESGPFTIESSIKLHGGINVNLRLIDKPELEVYGTVLNFTNSRIGEVRFHVAVKNKGKKDAENVPYELKISGQGRYRNYIVRGTFQSIPQGMTVTLDRSFVFEVKGRYVFTFTVNPDLKAFPEYNYNNNKVVKSIFFKGLPDLIVSFIGVGMHSRIGFSHDVSFEIKNIGDSSSPPCKLRTYIQGNGVKVFNVPAIAPGQIVKFKRSAKWFKLGYKKIEAIIDYGNIVKEKREDNNRGTVKTKVITGTIFD